MITKTPASYLSPHALPNEKDEMWVNVVNPSAEEYAQLAQEYNVPMDFLQAAADKNEHPRLEEDEQCFFVLIRASTPAEEGSNLIFSTLPIGILLTPTTIITICNKEGVVEEMLRKKLRVVPERPLVSILLTLFYRISTNFIDHIRFILNLTEEIEHTLQQSMQNKELLSLLHMEKSLIYFLTSLKANQSIIENLMNTKKLHLTEKEERLLEACSIEAKQGTDMGEIVSQILGEVGDTFGAIVSNNLNKVMKVLTGITIVLMVPTLIAGVYGMNVSLPMAGHPHAFAMIATGTAFISIVTGYIFWKKNWI